ncbi:phosphoribosylformylglycinamidine cyclo-ligase [Candidatus Micrarchaeota archaeon CG08_land_8_20_14_0_20_49_17]|nr:MAG: phosphoribosylformylglycinamidine cyclo-ligase [Candidatus Micrarchaeota archaeon CG1_02_49_24]PIU10014.1 MAG: phosphoribosylformylglycinamidine cyclo-ligase [Candidatus Micrarchaeota archaeon CG08_land_8_20_14_0_20_49_17]PIU81972.1 MAG: phosphoribosylformylglycinamidine cyclo-ligase [Candidatus Micrarchaeota archaeon CG06_land_8_20_14_3_00_50_6]PIZ95371.1 MAG: phosphoribosylformylglycinamidine cyclo-ligase [Candidatus Micrarchaeota archaeon CG_4_10_14_0_2_um_filter_49_7]HII53631.1 phos
MKKIETQDYASSGVNIKSIRKVQERINTLIKGTYGPARGIEVLDISDHYAGLYSHGGTTYAIHCDGVGSKVLVAQELGKYDTIGIDAVAMNVNDIACVGAEPLVCVDYLAVAKEDEKIIMDILKGLVDGCGQAKCALIGGETAVMPDVISGTKYPFDLAVSCIGKLSAEKPITGEAIKEGDALIGLESTGLHSNGYTLARRVLDAKSWGSEMLKPTAIYSTAISKLVERFGSSIHGIGHVTGGAFSKMNRLLKTPGLGMLIDKLPEPPEIFREIAKKVEAPEMYRTFNMGIGMVIACEDGASAAALGDLRKSVLTAHLIGKIVNGTGVRIKTKNAEFAL